MTAPSTQLDSPPRRGPDPEPENQWGSAKRLRFATDAIGAVHAASVLDVGCGTGTYLTAPLAERNPGTRFVGVDSDPDTLTFARTRHPLPNLHFCELDELPADERFDVVIASEVLEHVEDPLAFLWSLRRRLEPGGRIVLTVPNGFGIFSLAEALDALLVLTRSYGVLWRLKQRLSPGGERSPRPTQVRHHDEDTLALSPHVNFFSYRELMSILGDAGLAVRDYRGRTVVCGFLVGNLIRGASLVRWNANLADRLRPGLVSDWMFVLEPVAAPRRKEDYRRPRLARSRRALIARRWEKWPSDPGLARTPDHVGAGR